MALTYVAAGTVSSSQGSVTPGLPTGWAAGDLLLSLMGNKSALISGAIEIPGVPAGWTQEYTAVNGTTAAGIDTGSLRGTVHSRVAQTGDTALAISHSSSTAAIIQSQRVAIRRSAGTDYSLDITSGFDLTAGTDFSATGAQIDVTAGDILAVTASCTTDGGGTYSGVSVSVPGCTLGTQQFGTPTTGTVATNGGDGRFFTIIAPINSGTATGGPTLVWSNTISGDGGTGHATFVRVRETSAATGATATPGTVFGTAAVAAAAVVVMVATVAGTAAVAAPVVRAVAAPGAVPATAAIASPVVGLGIVALADVVAGTTSIPGPRLSRTPATVTGSTTVPASVTAVTAIPATVAGVASIAAPTVRVTIAPAVVAGTASVGAPTVTAGGGASVVAATVAGTAAVPARVTTVTAAPPTVAATTGVATPFVAFTYYVDSAAAGGGTGSLASPWNTLASVTSATLTPGQSVGLKRGSTFFSGLTISSAENGTAGARITIGAYGSGARPIIDVSGAQDHGVAVNGNFVTVQDLDLRNAGGTNDSGEWSGVTFVGATDGLIRRCRMSGSQMGARIVNGSHRCRITECDFVDNNKMTVNDVAPDNDYGAHAIFIGGASNVNDCEVDHNTSSGHVATSIDYGYDGSFVEVVRGDRTHIHHNTSTDDLTMAELSPFDTSCNDTWIHHNLCTRTAAVGAGRGTGFVCRGNRTVVEHNTVDIAGSHADGAGVTAIVATPVVDFLVRIRNNILIHGNNAIYTTAGADVQESYNLRQGNYNGVTQAGTSINAAPQFVSASDRHLSSTSPARDAGLGGLGYTTDRDDRPISDTPDMGCFEFNPALIAPGVVAAVAAIAAPAPAVTASPATVPGAGSIAAPGVRVAAAPGSVSGSASVSAPTTVAIAGPATVIGAAAIAASFGAITALPATVTGTAAPAGPGVRITVLPATVSGTAVVGAPAVTAGGGASITAITVAGATAISAPVVALTATPPTVVGGTSVGAPTGTVTASPATVVGTGSLTAPAPRITTAPGTVSAIASIPTVAPTVPDTTPPSVPANLHTITVGSATADIGWDASTDNVAVTGYDIKVIGP